MLLTVLDGNGVAQRIITEGQEAPTDASDLILVDDVAQDVLVANATRSGWFFQNQGANDMYLNDLGVAAHPIVQGTGSYLVPAGGSFPPVGYPVSTGVLSVIGTAGDAFFVREW